jgi:proteasome lid subunit RPN8/RPN11
VVLSRQAHDDIVAHARETAPAECCGLLVGIGETIADAVRTKNVDVNPNRFEIDAGDHIRARRAARALGREVLGFYHSHPHSDATPSSSDRAEAYYPDHLYLIVGLRGEPAEVRLYRLEADGFAEVLWSLEGL